MTVNADTGEIAVDQVSLVNQIVDAKIQVASLEVLIYHLETELRDWMRARGATKVQHPTHDVTLAKDSPSYDPGLLIPLRELVSEKDLEKVFKAAHEEVKAVGAKWNGTQLNRLEREYGERVAEIIKQARVAGREHIIIQPKGA
jgi:23S rRNA maturation mini-RNase III